MMRVATAGLTIAALVLLASGCSLRYDFSECQTDEDCQRVESEGEFLMCQNNRCVVAPEVECRTDEQCGEAQDCVDNRCEAVDTNDGGDDTGEREEVGEDADTGNDMADTADMSMPCSTNGECPGETNLCIDSACVEATTEYCQDVLLPTGDPQKYVVVGSILPLSTPYANIGPPLEQAIELAVSDFNNAGGLPGGRKIVWVSCSDAGTSVQAQEVATHLTENLDVPAIIGPLFSTPFIDVNSNITVDQSVFTITPTATSPSLTGLDDDGLAWRTIASDVFQGSAIVDRVRNLGVEKVTVFVKDDAYGNGLFNEISGPLSNELSDAGEEFWFIKYADPATFGFDPGQVSSEFTRVIQEALDPMTGNPEAELVILIGTTETNVLGGNYVSFVEQQMATPPRLLFSHGGLADLPDLVEQDPTLQPLVEGTAPDIFQPENFQVYTLRFRLAFGGQDPLTISTLTYDAALVTFFGMSAIPEDEELTGRKIADNIGKLQDADDGTVISFGENTFIVDGRNELAAGNTVDLIGVSGGLDFDLTTGDVRANVFGWEIAQDMNMVWTQIPERIYLINPPPATDGTWFEICGQNNPCSAGVCCPTGICVPTMPMCP